MLEVAFLHVISRTQYSTVSYRLCDVIRKIHIEIVHCTVYCTMRIEGRRHSVTREESCEEAMAERVMVDAAFSDIGGIPRANIFRFQRLM